MKTLFQYLPFSGKSSLLFFAGIFYILLTFSSCSQHNNSLLNKAFHNTTARYNAYFLAREKMKEVDQKIKEAHIDDYNRVLKVYPVVTESTLSGIKSDLEYIIEKAALVPNKHQNSHWVDDSYNIIGKARLYQTEYKLAVQTFKYVNTKSDDDDARHEAMIMLLKTYLDTLQIDMARAVNDFLKSESITKENAAKLYMTRAAYFQAQEDYDKMRVNLEASLEYIRQREDKARVHFIIGQIYQKQGNSKKAYEHYSSVFKNNPPYELFFYARLYLAQVSDLANSDKKKIDKYFRKLLKDQKNVEYRDKIYYEMGKYELKQDNIPKAIKNFQASLQENGNPFQKARTYLAMGDLHYNRLHQYETSKLYYDSTVSNWDPQDREYEAISKRQEILAEFVKYMKVVEREDSLLTLAQMDSLALDKYFDKIIIEEARKAREEAERLQAQEEAQVRRAQMNAKNGDTDGPTLPGMAGGVQEWYFYNQSAVQKGKADFKRKWGQRRLEDNWRRSQKQSGIDFETEKQEVVAAADPEKNKQDSINAVLAKKEAMYADIPFAKTEQDTALKRIENGLYNVGKIYNLKLTEPQNAVKTFEELIDRYPKSEHKPEVYYFLYLIYKKLENNEQSLAYKNKLYNEYPKSKYARILDNPNYLVESKVMNLKAAKMYKQAYDLYRSGAYISSDSLVQEVNRTYPENNIPDKLRLLSILNKGQTQTPVTYRKLLDGFIKEYPSSSLVPKAEELMATTDAYIKEQKAKGFEVENQIKYLKNFDRPHYFVCIFNASKVSGERLKGVIERYNKRKELKVAPTEQVEFSDSTVAIYFTGFNNKNSAKDYLENLCEKENVLSVFGNGCTPFIISSDNFTILQRSGKTDSYLEFFKRNYNDNLIYGN